MTRACDILGTSISMAIGTSILVCHEKINTPFSNWNHLCSSSLPVFSGTQHWWCMSFCDKLQGQSIVTMGGGDATSVVVLFWGGRAIIFGSNCRCETALENRPCDPPPHPPPPCAILLAWTAARASIASVQILLTKTPSVANQGTHR